MRLWIFMLLSFALTGILKGELPLVELVEVKRIPVDFTGQEITDLQVSSETADHLYVTTKRGKILRIDPEGAPAGTPYLIPPGNPFADGNDGSPEIIAWGLRNPWRFAFDPATGDIVIGDVGEDAWEELNRLTVSQMSTGANFGWPYREGPDATDLPGPAGLVFVDPFYSTQSINSIIGGVFTTSGDYQATLVGFAVPAGERCQLELSDDLNTWYPYGGTFVPQLNDVVRTVYRFDFHPKRWFRVSWGGHIDTVQLENCATHD